jgi:hypothetical protein
MYLVCEHGDKHETGIKGLNNRAYAFGFCKATIGIVVALLSRILAVENMKVNLYASVEATGFIILMDRIGDLHHDRRKSEFPYPA